jgi:hypothetical protein
MVFWFGLTITSFYHAMHFCCIALLEYFLQFIRQHDATNSMIATRKNRGSICSSNRSRIVCSFDSNVLNLF